jgi:hypothetical protein
MRSKKRSPHEDTNYVSAALSVDGHMVGSPQVKFMGDQNDGVFPVGISFPDVEVPEDSSVRMVYNILNHPHADQTSVKNALSDALLEGIAAPAGYWGILLKFLKQYGIPLVLPNCDGPITPEAGRELIWHTFELKGVAPGTKFEEVVNEPGNDSPSGCGPNSHYRVHVTVAAA